MLQQTLVGKCLWNTESEFLRHLRSDIYRQLLILMELSTEPPQVKFHHVAETHGLELVHATRGGIIELQSASERRTAT